MEVDLEIVKEEPKWEEDEKSTNLLNIINPKSLKSNENEQGDLDASVCPVLKHYEVKLEVAEPKQVQQQYVEFSINAPVKQENVEENNEILMKHDLKTEAEILCSSTSLRYTVPTRKLGNHLTATPVSCSICHQLFENQSSLRCHSCNNEQSLLKERTVPKNSYTCDYCKKDYMQKKVLIRHIKLHSIPNLYSCQVCHKVLKDSRDLKQHLAIHKKKRFSCTICKTPFNLKATLLSHMLIHTNEKPFKCDMCGKQFQNRSNLTEHESIHSGQRKHSCLICGHTFTHKTNLVRHRMRTHTGEKPFACGTCAKKFTKESSLRKHQKVHTEVRPFTCEFCKNTFKQLSSLKTHIKKHTGEELAGLSCDVCMKTFKSKKNLKRHSLSHSGDKPHVCPVCQHRFVHKFNLKSHMRVHSDEKPFSCEVCSKSFRCRLSKVRCVKTHARKAADNEQGDNLKVPQLTGS